jgi:hypothetical protein
LLRSLATLALVSATSVLRPTEASAHHNPQFILCIWNCSEYTRFTNYDYRQNGWGAVDWPTGFYFWNGATVNAVKNGICSGTTHSWKYCDVGGTMNMYVEQIYNAGAATGPGFAGFNQDGGRKRFSQNCGNPNWTAHMRIYGPPTYNDAFYDINKGFQVAASAHLDFEDAAGCAGRKHGWSEVGENWMIGTMNATPGWQVSYNTAGFLNANANHDQPRCLDNPWPFTGCTNTPHVYDNDRLATTVRVP